MFSFQPRLTWVPAVALLGTLFRGMLIGRLLSGQAECNRIECLPPHLQRLAIKYRNAIAEVIGVPPEAIREDVVVKWVKHWMKAYLKPEWQHVVQALVYTHYPEIVKHTTVVEVAPGVTVKKTITGVLY